MMPRRSDKQDKDCNDTLVAALLSCTMAVQYALSSHARFGMMARRLAREALVRQNKSKKKKSFVFVFRLLCSIFAVSYEKYRLGKSSVRIYADGL